MTAGVVVLLATHDGERWLGAQLDSIIGQRGVDLRLVVSDDASTDGTWRMLIERAAADARLVLLPRERGFGSATRNFLRLVRDADIGDASHVAFADQDDVWADDKLARAVEQLEAGAGAGYSSSVTALYADGRTRLIDKAQPQRRFDHLFESPGPGCSIVLAAPLFRAFRAFVSQHLERSDEFAFHDWLLYAFARSSGARWLIDPVPKLLYRQHDANVLGANAGFGAYRRRIEQVRSGRYGRRLIALCTLVESAHVRGDDAARALRETLQAAPTLLRRIAFIRRFAWQGRRRLRDRVALVALAALGWLWLPTDRGEALPRDNRSAGRPR